MHIARAPVWLTAEFSFAGLSLRPDGVAIEALSRNRGRTPLKLRRSSAQARSRKRSE